MELPSLGRRVGALCQRAGTGQRQQQRQRRVQGIDPQGRQVQGSDTVVHDTHLRGCKLMVLARRGFGTLYEQGKRGG